jgi:hypothetical protein
LRRRCKSDQREEKDPFSQEDLKAIFGSLKRADDAKLWAILALYMGGRSQEILKLKVTASAAFPFTLILLRSASLIS